MTLPWSETWSENEKQLFADWIKLGLRYPNEYIDAFLELTRGYWFWDDTSHAECLGYGVEDRMGLIYTYYSAEINNVGNVEHESKLPWLEELLEKIVSGNCYYSWPIVSALFKPSFYFWGMCLVLAAALFLKRKKTAVMCLFPITYMATMFLGPVVQIRYIFPGILVLPVLIAILFKREKC